MMLFLLFNIFWDYFTFSEKQGLTVVAFEISVVTVTGVVTCV